MTRYPAALGLTLGLLAVAGCGETATEPATARPLSSVPTFTVVSNSWITRAELPRGAPLASAALPNSAGQWIDYVLTGEPGGFPPRLQAYNVSTNTWSMKARFPRTLSRFNGAGVIGGRIYLSGGVDPRRTAQSALYRYNPGTDTWTLVSGMPSPGFNGVTGVINNQLYILTGCHAGADCDPDVPLAFYRYNPATQGWTTLPIPTSAHESGMGGVIGGKFYVVGGEDGLNQLDVYNPATNSWTTRAPMPKGQFAATGRWAGAGVALSGKLYVIGGWQRDVGGAQTQVRTNNLYNPATNVWTTRAPMPRGQAGIVGSRVVVSGQSRIEVVSGNRPGSNLQYIP